MQKFHYSISYNSLTEHPGPLKIYTFLVKIFGWTTLLPLLSFKISTPELFSLRWKIKKYHKIFYWCNTFSPFVSSISLQRNVFTRSNFQMYCFRIYVPINYWGLFLWNLLMFHMNLVYPSFSCIFLPLIFSYLFIVHFSFNRPVAQTVKFFV